MNILGNEQSNFSITSLSKSGVQLNILDLSNGVYFIEINFVKGSKLIYKIVKTAE